MRNSNKIFLVINLILAVALIIGLFNISVNRNKQQDNIIQEEPNGVKEENNVVENEVNENEDDEAKAEVISISNEKLNTEGLTLLSKSELDIDNNGEPEYVEMYTEAQKDEKGNIMWDDGQNWTLIFKDGDNEYQLFNGYIQLGELRYWAYTTGDNNEFHITTVMTQSAGLTLTDYTFDKDSESFNKTVNFNPENVNLLGSSY